MRFFQLAEIEPCIAKSHIRKIIFYRCINIFFSFDIIPYRTVNQEGITQIINVVFDCAGTDTLLLHTLKCR